MASEDLALRDCGIWGTVASEGVWHPLEGLWHLRVRGFDELIGLFLLVDEFHV